MRTVQYYIAASLNGFVTQAQGAVDRFVYEGDFVREYLDFTKQVSAVLMGRKTYEFGLTFGVKNPYPHLRQYVFSRSLRESPDPAVTLVSEDAAAFVAALKQSEGGPIWLCGAGSLAGALLRAGLIDELLVKLNPRLFGGGVPLFDAPFPVQSLRLLRCAPDPTGVVLLHYAIER
jgi:dihydrofolate reductase